ncbi:AraC family transcriptional regulator [Roseiconus nitratireducens]|uniref:AraC family transcriptional regulator n=1 Tax=Roseiconus nitratireducens TaxID=2605748 RepID=A0A5M6D3M0_9BACT|nr:AraC family transcriptional regulator [Roseiconus nitratireducens]KAA5541476.1 AraC family transcriptional regulator [Roseiconus nitratireducens]
MNKPKLTDRPLEENLPPWGVLVLESHHSPQFSMDWREHEFLKLVYVLRGRGVLEFPQQVIHFHEGDLVIVPPRMPNRITDAPDAASSLYVCCIASDRVAFDPDLIADLSDDGKARLISGDPHLSHRIATQLRRMRHKQSNQDRSVAISLVGSALRLIEWVLQAQQHADRTGTKRSGVISDRDVMEEYVARLGFEFYEATTIDAAAKSLGMSRRTFTKLFHEVTGETWLSRVRALAIRHAKHQLAQTNLSIASVAFECGFNDLSTFYRQFKSQVGVSPKAYRKSIK